MKKQIYFLFLAILLVGLVSATEDVENIGSYKFNSCIKLPQVCSSCTYSNISGVISPNGTIYISEQSMTKEGTLFYYNFCDTSQIGDYRVNGHFNLDGVDQTFRYKFTITPSGNYGNENTAFFIVIIVLVYGISLFGFFGRSIPMTILGGMAMLFLGIYLFNNGIIIYRDDITRYLSYMTIGLGALFAVWASYEWYQDL